MRMAKKPDDAAERTDVNGRLFLLPSRRPAAPTRSARVGVAIPAGAFEVPTSAQVMTLEALGRGEPVSVAKVKVVARRGWIVRMADGTWELSAMGIVALRLTRCQEE